VNHHLGKVPRDLVRGMLLLVLAGSAGCSTSVSSSSTSVLASGAASPTRPATSDAAVSAAIATSLKQHTVPKYPKTLTPSYLDIITADPNALQGTSLLTANCNPYSDLAEVSDPKPCIYGSTNASRTVVIFGDSYVGNWIPALNLIGKKLGYRIAAFEYAGCITPFVAPTGGTAASAQACNEWHTNLPAAVQAQNPVAILAANGTPSWGVSADPLWVQGITTAFDEMTASSPATVRILIGTSPHIPSPAPACLAAYPSSTQKCTLTYTLGAVGANQYAAALARDQTGAAAAPLSVSMT
jgi:hypothetical protein